MGGTDPAGIGSVASTALKSTLASVFWARPKLDDIITMHKAASD
jgi:hypothetical protein